MNSALSYLLWRRLSNTVKGLMKRPGTLVYVICLALVVFSAGMNGDAGAGTEGLNRQMFYGFLILFYAIVYVVTAKAGLSGGASFFSMADANLIFTGPVDNRRVLFHGLFQGLGTAALLGLVLVFQYAWLNNLFGVTAAVQEVLAEEKFDMPVSCVKCSGAAECKKALMLLRAGKLNETMIEGMVCEGGCVNGPAKITDPRESLGMRRQLMLGADDRSIADNLEMNDFKDIDMKDGRM